MKNSASTSENDPRARSSWGLPAGLVGLLAWLLGGLALEGLHAVKSRAYLEDPLRRLMFTLAHAHGALLSAIALLLTLVVLPRVGASDRAFRASDRLFAAGAVLVPLGFLLGGMIHPEGDPGLGILLVPAGALCCAAALVIALAAYRRR